MRKPIPKTDPAWISLRRNLRWIGSADRFRYDALDRFRGSVPPMRAPFRVEVELGARRNAGSKFWVDACLRAGIASASLGLSDDDRRQGAGMARRRNGQIEWRQMIEARSAVAGRSCAVLALILSLASSVVEAGIIRIERHDYLVHEAMDRLGFFDGKLLTAGDLDDEQSYKRSTDRHIGRVDGDLSAVLHMIGFADIVLLLDDTDIQPDKRSTPNPDLGPLNEDFIIRSAKPAVAWTALRPGHRQHRAGNL